MKIKIEKFIKKFLKKNEIWIIEKDLEDNQIIYECGNFFYKIVFRFFSDELKVQYMLSGDYYSGTEYECQVDFVNKVVIFKDRKIIKGVKSDIKDLKDAFGLKVLLNSKIYL